MTLPLIVFLVLLMVGAKVHGCLKCTHRETRDHTEPLYADPGRCDYCNP